jgi:hypothetical protein
VKVGAENRTKLFVALGLMLVAVVVLLFNLGSSAPKAATVMPPLTPPVPTSRPAGTAKTRGKKVTPATRSLDPTLRYDWLKASEDTKYEGTGRNIFRVFVEIPQPKVPVATDHHEASTPEGPPPPPPPPPIELKFYGFATPAGGAKRIFLAHNEDVFIAKEGEIVDRRYKVVRISPNSVEILDVLSNNRQSIPLTQG